MIATIARPLAVIFTAIVEDAARDEALLAGALADRVLEQPDVPFPAPAPARHATLRSYILARVQDRQAARAAAPRVDRLCPRCPIRAVCIADRDAARA